MAMSASVIGRPSRMGLDGVEAERDPEATGRFVLPAVADPALYVKTHLHARYDTEGLDDRLRFAKGTTTLGFKYKGGVIISVDSRSTQGPYVASGSVKKVIEINPYLLGTMAGGAADCAFWERNLGRQCRLHQLRESRRITVAAASKLLANTLAGYRGYGLSVGTMITGWDEGEHGEAQLYYVDNDGLRFKAKETMPYFSVGSGSTFAYGVLDSGYRWDMSDEEAVELGQRAIYHATHRDAYSGGFNNLFHVKKEGWVQLKHQDVFELHDMFGVDAWAKDGAGAASGAGGSS